MKACCVGPGHWREPRPSSVVTSRPTAARTGITQERAATPSISTVQAPHSPRPQPYLGPFSSRSLRSTCSSAVPGAAGTSHARALTCRRMGLGVLLGWTGVPMGRGSCNLAAVQDVGVLRPDRRGGIPSPRSEEHTSELQSQSNLVCRLLLEKKKKLNTILEVDD